MHSNYTILSRILLSEKATLPKEWIQKGVKAWNIRMSPPPDEPKCWKNWIDSFLHRSFFLFSLINYFIYHMIIFFISTYKFFSTWPLISRWSCMKIFGPFLAFFFWLFEWGGHHTSKIHWSKQQQKWTLFVFEGFP